MKFIEAKIENLKFFSSKLRNSAEFARNLQVLKEKKFSLKIYSNPQHGFYFGKFYRVSQL
jgi:hypothetical protein